MCLKLTVAIPIIDLWLHFLKQLSKHFEVYLLIILVCIHLENFESFLFEIFDVKIQVG